MVARIANLLCKNINSRDIKSLQGDTCRRKHVLPVRHPPPSRMVPVPKGDFDFILLLGKCAICNIIHYSYEIAKTWIFVKLVIYFS
jgi:hypothetical protein